jgi:hypothetical protein
MPIDGPAGRRDTPSTAAAAKRSKPPETAQNPTEVNAHVGALLRSMHDSVLNEAVPDRFLDVLRQIDDKVELADKD